MHEPILKAVAPFDGVALPTGAIRAIDRDGCGIALITARRGRENDVLRALAADFGIDLPDAGKCARQRGIVAVATAPRSWLIVAEQRPNRLAADLKQSVRDAASVVDQSDGYALLRLSGIAVPALLAKGVSIDVSNDAFAVDSAACTHLAHMNVTFWRLPDDPAQGPTFELALFRSFAASLAHWLSEHAPREHRVDPTRSDHPFGAVS
ncbi:sarcosine oxidase subunit gamma [Paraburkholderia sp. ZP32-5]|uniref:sarcosine oxidase subunit gamma n=1 Tax=Paraburkholderia sp. ZP32-5 TaxID=2883245 RepID=UPI001F30AD82|nr:sarcosine oxidase subunit gamma family protein [Paraburkholderia sp. ZP32-5]